ncbi:hypothetical protein HDU88_003466 [Geranomyces variabilis]|nr:hypothetical protein HDU88_003466 [Geranomyces variabilis]
MLSAAPAADDARQEPRRALLAALTRCCRHAALHPNTLLGVPLLDCFWIWLIRPCIIHPLRAIHARPDAAFFIASRRNDPKHHSGTDEESIELKSVRCVHVGNNSTALGERKSKDRDANVEMEIPASTHMGDELPLDEARYLLSLFCQLRSLPASSDILSLPSTLFALSLDSMDDSGSRPLSYTGIETQDDGTSTGTIYHIRNGSWVSQETDEPDCHPVPTVDELVADSRLHAPAPCDDCNDTTVDPPQLVAHIRAKYDILAESMFQTSSETAMSSISLEAAWTTTIAGSSINGARQTSMRLLSPPQPSAHVALRVRCVAGRCDVENQLPTAALRAELETLRAWDRMRCGDDGAWGEDRGEGAEFGRAATESRMSPHVVDLWLHEIKEEGFVLASSSTADSARSGGGGDTSGTFDLDAANALPVRSDLDFAERFWRFAQENSSNRSDLSVILNGVIEELETGKLRPMVNKTNHSSFARVIRDCYKLVRMQTAPDFDDQKEAISRTFDYWLEQPLELMVEIGIWKLKRDYCFHLVGGDVASWEELDSFVDATLPLELQVARLGRLHRVLELWALVKSNVLRMPRAALRALVQAALAHYTTPPPTEDGTGDEDVVDDDAADADAVDDVDVVFGHTDGDDDSVVVFRVTMPRFSAVAGAAVDAGGGAGGAAVEMVAGFEPATWSIRLTSAASSHPASIASMSSSPTLTPAYIVTFDRADSLFGQSRGAFADNDGKYKNNSGSGAGGADYDDLEALTDRLLAAGSGAGSSSRWRMVCGSVSAA